MTAWYLGLGFTALAIAGAWVRVTGANPARTIARIAARVWANRPWRAGRARYRHRGEPQGMSAQTRAAIREWLRG